MSEYDRDQARADLLAHPAASVRQWACRWDWSIPRVHRFLRSLERSGEVEVLRSKAGTTVTPRLTVTRVTVQNRPQLPNEAGVTAVTPRHLDTGLLDKSRCEEPRYTERLIETMNRVLVGRFDGYEPRPLDNRGSHRAGKELQAAGVPIDFALEQLAADCRLFNPSKHGNGDFPKSVGLFKKGILRAHRRRSQMELGLPPKLKVERGSPSPAVPDSADVGEVASPETIAAAMQEFKEKWAAR